MTQTLTIVCKIAVPPESLDALQSTLVAFANACTMVRKAAERHGTYNKVRLQRLVYRQVRADFGLSANLAIRAIARAAAVVKAKHRSSIFHPRSVDFDQRTFRFRERDWTVGLTLVGGAQRFSLVMGAYQRQQLSGQRPTSARLVRRPDGSYQIHIALTREPAPALTTTEVIGVDLGLRNLASLSTGERFGGAETDAYRDRQATIRRNLQRKGTKGAKRLLKRLSGRERRYMAWINHTISARIIRFARFHGRGVALEDLAGIRGRTFVRKQQRQRQARWAFHQLREFLEYKACRYGVELIAVNPAYTSQTCHGCLRLGDRRGDSFRCDSCGYRGHADHNAAQVIAKLGACVTRPEHSLACQLAS